MYTYLGFTSRACFTFDVVDMPGFDPGTTLDRLPGTIVRTGNETGVGIYRADGTFTPAYTGRTLTDGTVTLTGIAVTKLYFCLEDVVVGDAEFFYMNTGNNAENTRYQMQLFLVGKNDTILYSHQ